MKKGLLFSVSAVVLLGAGWIYFGGNGGEPEIDYRYEKVAKGELVRSISATGQVVALTSVDVKSKAGGIVVRLYVDEGTAVKKGDLIAEIDPRDTKAIYEQASSDVTQSQARAEQARKSYELQAASSKTSIADAEAALDTAKLRLQKAELENKRQPELTGASVGSARANFDSAKEDLDKYEKVTVPQLRRDSEGAMERTKAEYDAALADLQRQEDLLGRGYVAQAAVDRAKAVAAAARSSHDTAKQRMSTLDREISAEIRTLRFALDRSRAALDEANAGSSQIDISKRTLEEARKAVLMAEINLRRTNDNLITNAVRRSEVRAAEAATVRSRVTLDNAKVQLESTTVLAPRDGVVTLKYLEEGTIIPPGTSTFAQGTSIVQLSDVTRMFVECAVDEADIADVKEGQRVRIVTEAFPGVPIEGVVRRVNPAAQTVNNITAIKVRVEILPGFKVKIMPGMNATAEYLTLSKPGVLVLPAQAVKREGPKTYVLVKGADHLKPIRREVTLGDSGNNGFEVLSGLTEGEEVVTAEIDLKALRETQEKMLEAMQGGGLAGGRPTTGGRSMTGRPTAGGQGGAGGTGGGRPGGAPGGGQR